MNIPPISSSMNFGGVNAAAFDDKLFQALGLSVWEALEEYKKAGFMTDANVQAIMKSINILNNYLSNLQPPLTPSTVVPSSGTNPLSIAQDMLAYFQSALNPLDPHSPTLSTFCQTDPTSSDFKTAVQAFEKNPNLEAVLGAIFTRITGIKSVYYDQSTTTDIKKAMEDFRDALKAYLAATPGSTDQTTDLQNMANALHAFNLAWTAEKDPIQDGYLIAFYNFVNSEVNVGSPIGSLQSLCDGSSLANLGVALTQLGEISSSKTGPLTSMLKEALWEEYSEPKS